jgi:hypothetical protein
MIGTNGAARQDRPGVPAVLVAHRSWIVAARFSPLGSLRGALPGCDTNMRVSTRGVKGTIAGGTGFASVAGRTPRQGADGKAACPDAR